MGDETDGREGFDFLRGRWRVHNRRLARRLEDCTDWQEFEGFVEGQALLGGLGNIDYLHIPRFIDGKSLDVLDLKVFDPAAGTWSMVQADDRTGALNRPLVGRFSGGRGEFYCDDVIAGRPIRVRFTWSEIAPGSARWEQAFSPDGGETWETNWQMALTRVE